MKCCATLVYCIIISDMFSSSVALISLMAIYVYIHLNERKTITLLIVCVYS